MPIKNVKSLRELLEGDPILKAKFQRTEETLRIVAEKYLEPTKGAEDITSDDLRIVINARAAGYGF